MKIGDYILACSGESVVAIRAQCAQSVGKVQAWHSFPGSKNSARFLARAGGQFFLVHDLGVLRGLRKNPVVSLETQLIFLHPMQDRVALGVDRIEMVSGVSEDLIEGTIELDSSEKVPCVDPEQLIFEYYGNG